MKLIVAIIRPDRLNEVLEALYRTEVRGLTVSRAALGNEGRVQVPDTWPCRDQARPEVERAGERYIARAAASSSSKSGTSPVS